MCPICRAIEANIVQYLLHASNRVHLFQVTSVTILLGSYFYSHFPGEESGGSEKYLAQARLYRLSPFLI